MFQLAIAICDKILSDMRQTILDSFKIDDDTKDASKDNSSSDTIIEVRENDTYSFSGTVVSDSETTPGRVYYYLLLSSPVKCKINSMSTSSREVEVDSIQLSTGSVVNLDDYVNKSINVTGRFWLNDGSGKYLRKDVGLLADKIQTNQ